ncbi:acylneuraminate cytidylyltransferase family protein [Oceanimonas sp. CAM02]|uniref:acylneuraminate cytidylyltransferase family protein n=1 Tax=Oceanimonas sp. CAM02 TaxID=3080336 RepID=UPI0029364524|nr:acylneuraminate cytidylyltransferase family protein [Oceanimonas sp. CAM02]MDV2857683.1 acylneuraminate cytidylyltransferase family protein [Oceanimonas sp. CAM02]
MTKRSKYLAIIPARGGSKRLPGKNVLPLSGKPLIAWSIEAALACKEIDKVIITSDDDKILSVASQYPVELLLRPDHLATDTATSFDVIDHALKQYPNYEYTVLLQPTSPLRTATHIFEAITKLENLQAAALVSVCENDHNPLWSNTLPIDGNMSQFLRDEVKNSRSQDLPVYYRLNGAIYICKTDKLLQEKSFFLKSCTYAYVMDKISSVDIDTEIDFKWATFLLS